jgi:hypothetical protein
MLALDEAPLVLDVLGQHLIGIPHPNSAGDDIMLQVRASSVCTPWMRFLIVLWSRLSLLSQKRDLGGALP